MRGELEEVILRNLRGSRKPLQVEKSVERVRKVGSFKNQNSRRYIK